jgi:integrase
VSPLSPDQAREFLDGIHGDRLEALYLVALGVGLRQGEILGLAWSDIGFVSSTLAVRHALQRVDGRLILVEPKSVTSHRVVVMPAIVLDALRAHRTRQREDRLLAGSRWHDDERGLVFTTTIGTPMDGIAVTRRFQALLLAAGLPRQRFHDLRHACASLLLAQGVSPRVVMEALGHSQISLTLNTYSHVIPALGRAAAEQMDAMRRLRPLGQRDHPADRVRARVRRPCRRVPRPAPDHAGADDARGRLGLVAPALAGPPDPERRRRGRLARTAASARRGGSSRTGVTRGLAKGWPQRRGARIGRDG